MDPEEGKKVNLSTSRTFGAKLRSNLKETFFPDDPFRQFKGQSALRRTWGALEYFVPVLEWAPKYRFNHFRMDLLAGITIATLAIPQGISYARLANLPPVIGLYSSFIPPLVYAIFGSSNNLAVGTVAAASILMASMVEAQVPAAEEPELYLYVFFTAAFFTGVFQLALGIFRLGILVDFLSRSTILGFMGGTACLIILQQLKGMLGLKKFPTHTNLFSVLHSVFSQFHVWRWEAIVLGVIFLSFLLFTRHLKTRNPRLFWVSAISPLVVVILGCLLAYLIHAEKHGIATVGYLQKGLNPISISKLQFNSKYIGLSLNVGLISGFIALAEGIAVGRSLALLKDEQIDGNKEMVAYGMMNIVGSFFSCYLTTGPFSKSAVNYHAGCKTPMSNVVMAICMMLVLLFLAPLFSYTPLVALSAIIITAMIGLIEYEEAYHLYKVDKFDFCVCMVAFFGVLLSSMKIGLMASVIISASTPLFFLVRASPTIFLAIVRALLLVARPPTCKLGFVGENEIYCDMEQYPNSTSIPGILILHIGSSICFANAGYLRERISRWVEEVQNTGTKEGEVLHYVILDLVGVSSIDNGGIEMLAEVYRTLKKREIMVALASPTLRVTEKLVLANYIDLIGKDWVFISIKDAVSACQFALEKSAHEI